VWVPAALYIIYQGVVENSTWLIVKGAGLFLYGLIFVSTLDNFIRPKLISEKAKIHPVVVMVGVFGGMIFFGPIGLIVGPLVLCLTMVFLQVYLSGEMKE
jgi:predicted PurR-regulated permease PerM